MTARDDRIERSRLLYERAIFEGDASGLAAAGRDLDGMEADLAVARGRVLHASFLAQREEDRARATGDPRELALFERAAALYRELGDRRGEAEALFWIGCYHQVVRRDNDSAVPVLQRSLDLAAQEGDPMTMSEALRHPGIAEHAAGRMDAARDRLEEAARLRRDIGHPRGVAANLVGLAYIAMTQGRGDDARALLAEATELSEAAGARVTLRHIEQAREQLQATQL